MPLLEINDVQLAALVARAMDTHDHDGPGSYALCPSCKVLRDIPTDVLAAGADFLAAAELEQVV